jgi:hypothetical protein
MAAASKVGSVIQQFIDKGLFERLPPTFTTFFFDRIREWDLLFPAEQSYFERLFGLLDRSDSREVDRLFAPLREIERRMGVSAKTWNRREFTLGHVDFLNRSPQYPEWRAEIAAIFSKIDPPLEEEIARAGRPRLVIVIAPAELPVGPDRMWARLADRGKRIPIDHADSSTYLRELLAAGGGPSLLELCSASRAKSPYGAWLIESGEKLAPLRGQAVHLSYSGFHAYRALLMAEIRKMVETEGIRGPRQLGERLKKMKLDSGYAGIDQSPLLADFLRSVLLNGNGTLLINNTFVEWAAVQSARRARPALTVVSFGIRNKVKPFSSLLIYADQNDATVIPTQGDMLGSYVDLELFYLYLYNEFEKYPEYRKNTAYLFAGEGMDEMLAIAPADFPSLVHRKPVRLARIYSDCKAWLNLEGS